MKRIQTSKPSGMPRFIYALIVCALIATVGVSSGIAADQGPKVTLVYDHALPNVPGKSMKGVLVEYGPGVTTGAHIHPKSAFIYATVLKERSELRSMMGRSLLIAPDRTFPSSLVIDTLLMRMRARPNPLSCWPCSWWIRTKRNC
jgi:hypothetical protein